MGLAHDLGATKSLVGQPQLLRRLTIICPVTRQPTDTGFELTALPLVTEAPQWLLDCLECGQDHMWSVDDVSLE